MVGGGVGGRRAVAAPDVAAGLAHPQVHPVVAAVLSYRLATYWLPIVPGWIGFQLMERRNLI